MSMYNYQDADRYGSFVFPSREEEEEPVCVCPDHFGAARPVYCHACLQWTDQTEAQMMEAAEERKPVRGIISTIIQKEVA
jgi:hypothetical protein